MPRILLFAIGLIYLLASLSFILERKWLWALVTLSWAVGNFALVALAREP